VYENAATATNNKATMNTTNANDGRGKREPLGPKKKHACLSSEEPPRFKKKEKKMNVWNETDAFSATSTSILTSVFHTVITQDQKPLKYRRGTPRGK
jgi:hypothetical protein